MSKHHDHSHDRSFDEGAPSEWEILSRALQELMIEKGVITAEQIRTRMEQFDADLPYRGPRVIARAWTDPAFKQRLLADATAAIAEMGYVGRQGEHMVAVENTPKVHNMVVCTLCSCYPWPVLGLPPVWYKSTPYRSRAVIDPRGVLHEFGLDLAPDVEVRVWDSTSEVRYLVLPERPPGTEGMSAEQLTDLVTRDSMIGAEQLRAPGKGGKA